MIRLQAASATSVLYCAVHHRRSRVCGQPSTNLCRDDHMIKTVFSLLPCLAMKCLHFDDACGSLCGLNGQDITRQVHLACLGCKSLYYLLCAVTRAPNPYS